MEKLKHEKGSYDMHRFSQTFFHEKLASVESHFRINKKCIFEHTRIFENYKGFELNTGKMVTSTR